MPINVVWTEKAAREFLPEGEWVDEIHLWPLLLPAFGLSRNTNWAAGEVLAVRDRLLREGYMRRRAIEVEPLNVRTQYARAETVDDHAPEPEPRVDRAAADRERAISARREQIRTHRSRSPLHTLDAELVAAVETVLLGHGLIEIT